MNSFLILQRRLKYKFTNRRVMVINTSPLFGESHDLFLVHLPGQTHCALPCSCPWKFLSHIASVWPKQGLQVQASVFSKPI